MLISVSNDITIQGIIYRVVTQDTNAPSPTFPYVHIELSYKLKIDWIHGCGRGVQGEQVLNIHYW